MSEKPNNQENQETIKEETQTDFSDIKQTQDYSSPEGPSSDFPEIRCPLCPKFAKITINHLKNEIISECPDNHYMKLDFLSFLERSTDHPIACTKCSICNSTGKTNKYCLECNKYFCDECMEKHNKNDLPYNNGGVYSNILLRNNTLDNNQNINTSGTNLNTSFPQHLTTLNLANNNCSSINTVQHHVINLNEQDNHCGIHSGEKFVAFCLKCNKSFCQNCLGELKKGAGNNINILSCGKFGNINHTIKKMKDILGDKNLKKIKQNLDKEVEVLNYIENQSNIIIEQILEKINNLREIHSLKQQLYSLYLINKENASLVRTISDLGNGFNLQKNQFNTSEKLLDNLEIIKLPKEEDKKIEINNSNNNNNINIIDSLKEEDKKKEVNVSKIDKKNEIRKAREEKKKQIQKIRENKKKEIRKKKEEMKKLKAQKKKVQNDKTIENNKKENVQETKGGEKEEENSNPIKEQDLEIDNKND